MEFSALLERLAGGEHLTQDDSSEAISSIMRGELDVAQTAGLLTALRCKGETADEIAGAASAMRSHAFPMATAAGPLIDTCGTGGDRRGTFNISTLCALTAAGAGVYAAKHGNRSASSQCGSIDLLEALGVNIEMDPARAPACLEQTGMCVLFARLVHPAMKHAAPARSLLGIRTIFNWLGPLTNPLRPPFQLIGVSNAHFLPTYAQCLQKLGIQKAWVVSSEDGLDEITVTAPTKVIEVTPGHMESFTLDPSHHGMKGYAISDLKGAGPAENAEIAAAILGGKERGAKRHAVAINAGAALYIAGKTETLREGIAAAEDSLDSGRAKAVLENLVRFTNDPK